MTAAPHHRSLARLLACLLVLLGSVLPGRAEVQIFMKIANGTGEWAGEATAVGRTGWTKLHSLSFGISNPTAPGDLAGGGGGTGTQRSVFSRIALTKNVDRISPAIFAGLAGVVPLIGGQEGDVVIEFVRTGTGGQPDAVFMRLQLKTVLFNLQKNTASSGEDISTETVEISAGVMRMTYWPVTNGVQGPPVVRTWNVIRNNDSFNP